jgi:hypothetical protein
MKRDAAAVEAVRTAMKKLGVKSEVFETQSFQITSRMFYEKLAKFFNEGQSCEVYRDLVEGRFWTWMERLGRPTEVGDRGWDNAVDAEKRDCGGGGRVAD